MVEESYIEQPENGAVSRREKRKAVRQIIKEVQKNINQKTNKLTPPDDDDDKGGIYYIDWQGIAGFGLGVAALITFFVPILPLILGALAVTFSISSMIKTYSRPEKYIGKSLAVLGLIFGALAIIIGILVLAALFALVA